MDGCGHISFQASLASSTGANAATEGYLVFPDFSVLESPKKCETGSVDSAANYLPL